jgi:hypothetical protein
LEGPQGVGVSISQITGRQFATRFALRPEQFAWFLGAGASASARIPTGYDMITDFKATLFCQGSGTPRREIDPSDPVWKARIEVFLAQQGSLPPAGDPTEYARAFEAVYPSVEDRRTYIAQKVQQGVPSYAHRVLACMLVTGKVPCIFTTNFDNLVESATTIARSKVDPAKHKDMTVAAIDSADRAARCVRENDWPLLAKIHGDFQSVDIKNTEQELVEQDTRMRSVLAACAQRFALVVVGYSGRDTSVMKALTDALAVEGAYPGGIYWMTRSPSGLLPAVHAFLEAAVERGVSANLLVAETFDELAGDLLDVLTFEDVLKQHIQEVGPTKAVVPVPLPDNEARKDPILRCSALRVMRMPSTARRISFKKPASIVEVRGLLKAAKVGGSIAAAGRYFAAFGKDKELLGALAPFEPTLEGEIALDPEHDSWALGLLYDAFVRAVCRGRPLHPRLRSKGHRVVVTGDRDGEDGARRAKRLKALGPLKSAYGDPLYGRTSPPSDLPFNEAIDLRLEQVGGRWWCVFDAFTHVDLPEIEAAHDDEPVRFRVNPAADWLRERWAQRYNRKWTAIIDAWSQLLAGEARTCWLKDGEGVDAVFHVGPVSAWSRPSHDHAYFHRGGR